VAFWLVAREAAALAERNERAGTAEAAVLFVEQDGVWLHLQGKSREENGKPKEMKTAIAYDGAAKEGGGRCRLTGKVAAASFEPAAEFNRRREGAIAEAYDADEIKYRLVNGDGAAWIKPGADDDTAHFQLDPYHRNRAIIENVRDDAARSHIFVRLGSKRIDEALEYIDALANSAGDEAEEKKLRFLHGYLSGNKEGLIGWRQRGLGVSEPPEGKEYRGMGAMESNVFTIAGNRMKGGRACWSINGGNNLAGLLALKHTGRLGDAIGGFAPMCLPEKYCAEARAGMSPSKAPAHDGKGYEPPRAGAAPATPDWAFLRNISRGGGVFAESQP
jgi:hypothetical protein